MKSGNVFWGVILVVIGLLFIFKNLGFIYFDWCSIFNLWPLLLVLFGIAILPIKNLFKVLLSIIALFAGVMIFSFSDSCYNNFRITHDNNRYYFNDDDDEDYEIDEQVFTEPYNSDIEYAELQFDAVAGKFRIKNVTNDLLYFNREGSVGPYSFISKNLGNKQSIQFRLKNSHYRLRKWKNEVDIKLNENPIWDFDLDIGAAKVDLDLSKFKTRKIKIDGGASSVEIKLGDKHNKTRLNIDSGVSSISIKVPEKSGCEIFTSTVLSSKNLYGFDKYEKHTYRTPNFSMSENKIYINIDAAISSLNIRRY